MAGRSVPGQAVRTKALLQVCLAGVSLLGCFVAFSTPLDATSVVALVDHANHRVVIAADCRVNRDEGSVSACKIIQDRNCTVAMAGLYEERNTGFHLAELVHSACEVPGDLRAKAEAFLRISRKPFARAVKEIREGEPGEFAKTIANKPTEVVFSGIQDGKLGLIVRGLVASSDGKIRVERFESTAPSYPRIGYFVGLNDHIRAYLKAHPDWVKVDYTQLAPRLVELEVQAHPDLAGLPVSVIQVEESGLAIWVAYGACRPPGATDRSPL